MRKLTEHEVELAAQSDPDAQPLTNDDLNRMRRSPKVKVIRRALGLTQEDFALRFHIPLGTLRDWEQGRKPPDQTACTYLKVIAHEPEAVLRALQEQPDPSA